MRNDIKHIIDRLKSECQFDKMPAEKDSYYKLIVCDNECIVEIRISNHKTDLNTWAERTYKNGMYPHVRLSIVFRENDFENVRLLRQPRRKPIVVTEWVYDLRETTMDDDTITKVRDAIRNINGVKGFSDMVGTAEKPYNVVSINPSNKPDNPNNQETNENIKMNKKQTIRLNEAQFNNLVTKIVKESVKRVLKESEYDDRNHHYTENDMAWLYKNQDKLSPTQEEVLKAGMWLRARQANYQGYAKRWPNVVTKDSVVYLYNDEGKLCRWR